MAKKILTALEVSGEVTAVSFDAVSDSKFKENIATINRIDVIDALNPVSFTWKNNGKVSYGFIAQEVEKVIPAIVTTNKSGDKSVSYDQIIPFLVKEMQDLKEEIRKLKA